MAISSINIRSSKSSSSRRICVLIEETENIHIYISEDKVNGYECV